MVLDGRTRDAAASKARVSSGVLPSVWERRFGRTLAGLALGAGSASEASAGSFLGSLFRPDRRGC